MPVSENRPIIEDNHYYIEPTDLYKGDVPLYGYGFDYPYKYEGEIPTESDSWPRVELRERKYKSPSVVRKIQWSREDGAVAEADFGDDGTITLDAEAFRLLMKHAGFKEENVVHKPDYARGGFIKSHDFPAYPIVGN